MAISFFPQFTATNSNVDANTVRIRQNATGTGAVAGDAVVAFVWIEDTAVTITNLNGFTLVAEIEVADIHTGQPGKIAVLTMSRASSASVDITITLSATVTASFSNAGHFPPAMLADHDWRSMLLSGTTANIPVTASVPTAVFVFGIGEDAEIRLDSTPDEGVTWWGGAANLCDGPNSGVPLRRATGAPAAYEHSVTPWAITTDTPASSPNYRLIIYSAVAGGWHVGSVKGFS